MTNNRQKDNFLIICYLTNYINEHPDVRFNQALQNLNIVKPNVDLYYEESSVTLENVKKSSKEKK